MGRLTEAEFRRVTRVLTRLDPGPAEDPLPTGAMVELRDAFGADEAEYFELRRADRGVIAHAQSHVWSDAPGTDEALRAFGHQNPLGWRRFRPSDGALRLSARTSRRALENLEFYHLVMRPNRVTDGLKVWLHSDDASVACLHLWRKGSTFTQAHEDMLAVMQPHLVRLRSEAIHATHRARPPATLTRREAEVLSWAIRGETDAAIGARLGIAAATAGKHLEHAFAKLGVHSRTEALWAMSAGSAAAADGTPSPRTPSHEVGGRLDA